MSNSVVEVQLVTPPPVEPDPIDPEPIARGANVVFNEQTLSAAGIDYNDQDGVFTFNNTGQYSIKWWIATETTLKGAVVFYLESSGGRVTPGCSPIKTGQVSGFGVIDVDTTPTTLSLINRSISPIVISRKAGTKGYMLITPIGQSSVRVYRGNLSAAGSFIQAPLGNGLYYRLEHLNSTQLRLVLTPMNGSTRYDYRRFCSYNGIIALEGDSSDNALISGQVIKDSPIYNNSQEMHWVLIRVQNPITSLWSTYEVRFFASGGISRVTVWVNVIEEEVSY